MRHPVSRHPDGLEPPPEDRHRIAWVIGKHPVSAAAAHRVVFDALDDPPAIRPVVKLCPVEVIRLIELDLHRRGQAVTGPASAAQDKYLAAFDHFPHGEGGGDPLASFSTA